MPVIRSLRCSSPVSLIFRDFHAQAIEFVSTDFRLFELGEQSKMCKHVDVTVLRSIRLDLGPTKSTADAGANETARG